MQGTRRPPQFQHRFLVPLLLALALVFATSLAHARQMVSIAKENVNMRSGPGTRNDAMWGLAKGYPLEVLGRRSGWVQVRDFEGDKGWVFARLTNKTAHHIVKSKTANVRSQPSTRGRIVDKVAYGDVMRTLQRRNGWVKVQLDRGRTGWISGKLLWGW